MSNKIGLILEGLYESRSEVLKVYESKDTESLSYENIKKGKIQFPKKVNNYDTYVEIEVRPPEIKYSISRYADLERVISVIREEVLLECGCKEAQLNRFVEIEAKKSKKDEELSSALHVIEELSKYPIRKWGKGISSSSLSKGFVVNGKGIKLKNMTEEAENVIENIIKCGRLLYMAYLLCIKKLKESDLSDLETISFEECDPGKRVMNDTEILKDFDEVFRCYKCYDVSDYDDKDSWYFEHKDDVSPSEREMYKEELENEGYFESWSVAYPHQLWEKVLGCYGAKEFNVSPKCKGFLPYMSELKVLIKNMKGKDKKEFAKCVKNLENFRSDSMDKLEKFAKKERHPNIEGMAFYDDLNELDSDPSILGIDFDTIGKSAKILENLYNKAKELDLLK